MRKTLIPVFSLGLVYNFYASWPMESSKRSCILIITTNEVLSAIFARSDFMDIRIDKMEILLHCRNGGITLAVNCEEPRYPLIPTPQIPKQIPR